jgi:hypothetical protein
MLRWPRLVTVTWLASEQISRAVSQSVLPPCASSKGCDRPQQWYTVQCSSCHALLGRPLEPCASRGSLVQMRKESVLPRSVTRDDLHGDASELLNSSAPRRSRRATSYVPA